MFRNTISFANIVNGTGSLVLTDDLEIYNRIGMGLSSEGAEWIEIGRGLQSDCTRLAWRSARAEFDERNLYPQHAASLAELHDQRPRRNAVRHLNPPMAKKGKTPAQTGGASADGRRRTPPGWHASAEGNLIFARCEQFLLHEARLLDDGKFDDWLALFTPEAWYWVPSEPGSGRSVRDRLADLR